MPNTYRALWVEKVADNSYTQRIAELSEQDLPENELLVEVHYSSLNYKDALSAQGHPGVTKNYPHTPGVDAAGIVLEDKSGQFKPGDSVIVCCYDLGMNTAGGLSQRIRVPARWAVSLPANLSLKQTMQIGTAGFTAAACVDKLRRVGGAKAEDGEVIVTGATGGVGSFSVALLHHLGFDVVAVTGKLQESERLVKLGAKQVLDRAVLLELSPRALAKAQWAHGIDCVGGDYIFNMIKSIRYGGSVAACGMAAGGEFSANVFPFILRGVNLLGVDCAEMPIVPRQALWNMLGGELKLDNLDTMAEEITLDQVSDYLSRMYNGQAVGRYLVNCLAKV